MGLPSRDTPTVPGRRRECRNLRTPDAQRVLRVSSAWAFDRLRTMNAMVEPEIPPVVRTLLEWWQPRVRDVLGDKIASMALHGSVALGDFAPRWSDVDVCVVLRGALSAGEESRLERISADMDARFIERGADRWVSGQAVEAAYVEEQMVAVPDDGPPPPFDRLVLSRFSLELCGGPAAFAPPTPPQLRSQLRSDLGDLRAPIEERSAIWLAGTLAWIARSLVFWRDGELVSKGIALEREIAAGSTFADAFRLGLAVRQAGSRRAAEHDSELRAAFAAIAGPSAALLGGYGSLDG